jgi:hypothetical protein
MEKITESELKSLVDIHSRHKESKLKIADLEIAKAIEMNRISKIEEEYMEVNKMLSTKYGNESDITIDSSTGEIKRKK